MDLKEQEGAVVPPERRPRCAQHGKATAEATCQGCGLFLCAECASPEDAPRCARCGSEGHPIPWEDSSRGRIGAFFATLMALLSPDRFFGSAPWTGGLKAPLYFAILAGFLAALVSTVFGIISAKLSSASMMQLLTTVSTTLKQSAPPGDAARMQALLDQLPEFVDQLNVMIMQMQVVSLLLDPISTALGVLVLAALSHPIARWLGGEGTFEGSFRVIAYATGARVLEVAPGVGGLAALVFGLALVTIGMRRAHGLSGMRSFVVAAWWVPVALFASIAATVWLTIVWLRTMGGG